MVSRNFSGALTFLCSLCCCFGFSSSVFAQEPTPEQMAELKKEFHEFVQLKAFQAQMRGNMRTVQIAVESYATDSGGVYPQNITDAAPYMSGGSNSIGGKPGPFDTNPVSGVANEVPYNAGFTSLAQVTKMAKLPPQYTNAKPGQVGYSMFNSGKSYAINGTDRNGNAIPDKDGLYMILSNETVK